MTNKITDLALIRQRKTVPQKVRHLRDELNAWFSAKLEPKPEPKANQRPMATRPDPRRPEPPSAA